ncbi:MAG: PhzF family phenazine biosynthesis protein [Ornithinimicrobium sp.]
MSKHLFSQVDVFAGEPMRGNPVAVVHDAVTQDGHDLATEEMQAFARWTNLSETTFVLPPRDPSADYRLRIFTPGGELPFAGHPTLGSCRAWLAVGGTPSDTNVIVQECTAGLVRIRQAGGRLAFAAPPLVRSGPPQADLREAVTSTLGLTNDQVVSMSWVANGPNWLGVLLRDADTVLGVRPDFAAMRSLGDVEVGVIGPHEPGGPADYEVRAFCPELGVPEDPVTGSLQAGLAQWLVGAGVAPDRYVAAQGTAVSRVGRVYVDTERIQVADVGAAEHDGGAAHHDVLGDIWIGGDTMLRVAGAVDFG